MVDNLRYLVGMEALYAAQAVDLREGIRLGKYTRIARDTIRETIPEVTGLRNTYDDIQKAYALILSEKLLERTENA